MKNLFLNDSWPNNANYNKNNSLSTTLQKPTIDFVNQPLTAF